MNVSEWCGDSVWTEPQRKHKNTLHGRVMHSGVTIISDWGGGGRSKWRPKEAVRARDFEGERKECGPMARGGVHGKSPGGVQRENLQETMKF